MFTDKMEKVITVYKTFKKLYKYLNLSKNVNM